MLSYTNKALDETIMRHLMDTGIFNTDELMKLTGANARTISRSWHRIIACKSCVDSIYDVLRCYVIAFPPIRMTRKVKKNGHEKKEEEDNDDVLLVEPIDLFDDVE